MGLFGFLKPKNEEDERKKRFDEAARELVSDEEVARWWAEMDEGQQALCMDEVGSYVPVGYYKSDHQQGMECLKERVSGT